MKCCADRDLMFPMAGFQPPSAISGEVSQHGTSIKSIGFSGSHHRNDLVAPWMDGGFLIPLCAFINDVGKVVGFGLTCFVLFQHDPFPSCYFRTTLVEKWTQA